MTSPAIAKAIERIAKLLRVAAPSSGASPAEQSIAALEACRLISVHGLSVGPPAPARPVRIVEVRPARSKWAAIYETLTRDANADARKMTEDPFVAWEATRDEECAEESCDAPIFRGDKVWRRMKNGVEEYVHADCWHQ